jgi:hypothetical protein
MPNDRQGEKPDQEVVKDIISDLEKLENQHKKMQAELDLAVKVVENLKTLAAQIYYGPSCGNKPVG